MHTELLNLLQKERGKCVYIYGTHKIAVASCAGIRYENGPTAVGFGAKVALSSGGCQGRP